MLLLDASFGRTLDELTLRLERERPGGSVEAWLMEDEAPRRAAEGRLAASGVRARLRSAYKPLLHFFLEELELSEVARAVVRYPVHPAASPLRFRLEAYPLAALLDGRVTFESGGADLAYRVELGFHDGRSEIRQIEAPNHLVVDHLGQQVLVPTGLLRIAGARDQRLPTEHEVVHAAAMAAVASHDWGNIEPCFEVLELAVTVPAIERVLPWGEERISTAEALHEDLYFSVLEHFQQRSGRADGDRTLRPGQIVPEIRAGDAPHLRITTRGFDDRGSHAEPSLTLATADRPLSPAQIEAELAALGGEAFQATSRQGRPVSGRYLERPGPAIVITAGQHANEPSGIVGGLRAAERLAVEGVAHFAIVPLENPDGHALCRHLRLAQPHHMHHAARYTALGDDLEYRRHEPLLERAARNEAFRRSGARLHLSLHGYPAHEWTRPFTGYLPRGFEAWSLPKGFFLLMSHAPGLAEPATAFTHALARELALSSELTAFNRAQLAVYRAHMGEVPFPIVQDIPCRISESIDRDAPFTLTTEHPDETVYGDALRLAHETQMRAVLIAARLVREGMLEQEPPVA